MCKRARFRVGLWASGLSFASVLGCGDDSTTLLRAESAAPGGSRVLEVLRQPETLDAACRLIGVSSRNVGGASASVAACVRVVEQCQSTVGVLGAPGAEGETAAGPELGGGDLQELLGCPVTVVELDTCLAQILESGRDSYAGEVSCETTTLPEIDPAFLFTVPACFGVVLQCPELLSLGELFGAPE
jgi:hypothetical protein